MQKDETVLGRVVQSNEIPPRTQPLLEPALAENTSKGSLSQKGLHKSGSISPQAEARYAPQDGASVKHTIAARSEPAPPPSQPPKSAIDLVSVSLPASSPLPAQNRQASITGPTSVSSVPSFQSPPKVPPTPFPPTTPSVTPNKAANLPFQPTSAAGRQSSQYTPDITPDITTKSTLTHNSSSRSQHKTVSLISPSSTPVPVLVPIKTQESPPRHSQSPSLNR